MVERLGLGLVLADIAAEKLDGLGEDGVEVAARSVTPEAVR